jgi:hypothetical protein
MCGRRDIEAKAYTSGLTRTRWNEAWAGEKVAMAGSTFSSGVWRHLDV